LTGQTYGSRLKVEQIVSRWRGTAGRFFRVRASDGHVLNLVADHHPDAHKTDGA